MINITKWVNIVVNNFVIHHDHLQSCFWNHESYCKFSNYCISSFYFVLKWHIWTTSTATNNRKKSSQISKKQNHACKWYKHVKTCKTWIHHDNHMKQIVLYHQKITCEWDHVFGDLQLVMFVSYGKCHAIIIYNCTFKMTNHIVGCFARDIILFALSHVFDTFVVLNVVVPQFWYWFIFSSMFVFFVI